MNFLSRVFLFLVLTYSQISMAGNYILKVDDQAFELNLDENAQIEVNNQLLNITLSRKNSVTYFNDSFSFEHDESYTPTRSALGQDIHQTSIITPLGTFILVQEYHNIDPANAIELIFNEVVKEEKESGFDLESQPHAKILVDGTKLVGKKVISQTSESNIERYFLTYSENESGILIMTRIDHEVAPNEKNTVDQFFESLRIQINKK